MALSSKGLAYLVVAYAFIGLALMLREPLLTAFVIPNAILLLFSSRVPSVRAPTLSIARRMHPPHSFGGEDVDVIVKVTNDSTQKIEDVRLEDHLPDSLAVKAGAKATRIFMSPHETAEFWYRISAPARGRYVLGPVSYRTTDAMGFHGFRGEINGLDDVIVFPEIQKLGPIELRARRVGPWPGLVPSRKIGPGTEFFELRTYAPGDDLRSINWKASAKSGRLISNEFEGEHVTDVLVVLDCSEGSISRLFDPDVVELEISLAASLCAQLIHQGNRVGLSVYGAVRDLVYPAFGKRQLLRLLNSLTIVTPGRASISLEYCSEPLIVYAAPARSVIVFISPLMNDETVSVITNLAARGYGVMVLTPAVISEAAGMAESMLLAKRILSLERRIRLKDVHRVANVLEFSTQTNIRRALRRWRPSTRI